MMYNRSTKSKYQKIKFFKIFKFSPQGVPIGTPGSAKSLIFYSFANVTKTNRKSDVRNRIFSIPRLPMAQKWSSNGRPDLLKMSPKSTRERTADPAASPKRPKDTPKSRSQHSGRVGGRSYARLKAEIALHNIPTATRHDTQPPIAHFQIFCRAATTCARIDPKSSPHRFAHSYSEVRGQSGTKINVDLPSRVHVNFTI